MKQTYFIIALLMFNFSIVNAQVGINTDNTDPDASAMLDVKSTDKGLLVPRMTTTQRTAISNPANGLLVFDSTTGSFWFYDSAAWTELKGGTAKEIADADNDTKIQVEESADEDTIRFDVGGLEFAKMDGKTLHLNSPGQSLFIGKDAGLNDDGSDNKNVAIGYEAMQNNTTGSFNTANGLGALKSNTTANENTASGYQALYNNTTGYHNTANGTHALLSNTTGHSNTASGRQALYSDTWGHSNTASGQQALYSNTSGSENTGVGHKALYSNTTGNSNTASGWQALFSNITGHNNTGIGRNADVASDNLNNATAIGASAVVDASNKIQLGDTNVTAVATSGTVTAAGFVGDLQDADNDTKIQVEESADEDKIRFDVAGTEIAFLDNKTFHLKAPGNSLFIGEDAGLNDDGSNPNVAVGFNALKDNTSGRWNTANGFTALSKNTTGIANTANGHAALSNNTTGNQNTANGQSALTNNTLGNRNTANGQGALANNTQGNHNTAIGQVALSENSLGNNNTANGQAALFFNTTGSNNTATGMNAMDNNSTGNSNTAIGFDADVASTGLNNATAIGANAVVDASNKIQLGDANVTAVATSGTVTAAGFVGDGSGLTNLNLPGDHLGNHTATQALDMANQNVVNGGTVTAAGFVGDLQDADNDTKIQVEESADEDKIRFDVAGTEAVVINAGGNIGIGTSNPTAKLDISDGNINSGIRFETSSTGPQLTYKAYQGGTKDLQFIFEDESGTSTEVMRIKGNGPNSGNVGIGTDSPLNPLSVRSTADSNLVKLELNLNNSPYHTFLGQGLTSNPNGFFINARGDNGTFGNIQLQTNDVTRMSIESNGKIDFGYGRIAIGSSNYISADGDSEGIQIHSTGVVGIGNNSVTNSHFQIKGSNGQPNAFAVDADSDSDNDFAVESNGDIFADLHANTYPFPNNVVLDTSNKLRWATSSRRYKKNIKPANLDADVEKYLSLVPKAFQFKEDPKGIYDYGFIAEEVYDLGLTNPLANVMNGKVESIYFDHIAFYNFAAIKQHHSRIKNLEKRNVELMTENELLQAKLEKMENLEQRIAQLEAAIRQ